MSPSTTRPVIDSSSSFDWASFPNYPQPLSGPLTPATSTEPEHSPLHHPSSLPHNSAPISMSFPVQTSYPYSFHDSQLPVQSHVPPVNPHFSYPSPEIDLQHILEMPIPCRYAFAARLSKPDFAPSPPKGPSRPHDPSFIFS